MRAWSMVEFSAMGSPCRIVAPDAEMARAGEQLVHDLEQRWSRFLPSSEVSALNEQAGRLTIVSPDTFELVATAERARQATSGAFNPLMLDQLCRLGYDESWEHVSSRTTGLELTAGPSSALPPHPATNEPIELFAEITAVRLPEGSRFDPGGIGKGLAGDFVARRLMQAGATTVQVELGGDVRVEGPSWDGGDWSVRLNDSDHGNPDAAAIRLAQGGVATSSTIRRRWSRRSSDGRETVHHLLDSHTGVSVVTDLDAVTAVASTLAWAEVVAKVALMAGHDKARSLFREFGVTGVLIGADPAHRYDVVANSRFVA